MEKYIFKNAIFFWLSQLKRVPTPDLVFLVPPFILDIKTFQLLLGHCFTQNSGDTLK